MRSAEEELHASCRATATAASIAASSTNDDWVRVTRDGKTACDEGGMGTRVEGYSDPVEASSRFLLDPKTLLLAPTVSLLA